jgi:coproporphyrinogen III oxidase-like Fe-S oxidoreductase
MPNLKEAVRRVKTSSLEELRWHSFLTSLCNDEHEPYFPADGTYYSSCGYFRRSNIKEIKEYWRNTVNLIKDGKAPEEIGIYLHWPFCISQCLFCFCSMDVVKTTKEMRQYADVVKREIDELYPIFEGMQIASVYFGGGTPTLAPDDVLDDLLGHIRNRFTLSPDSEIYVEASPGTLTNSKMDILIKRGVNRITIGVQSLDSAVLKTNDRKNQPRKAVLDAIDRIAKAPGVYSGVELMFGMEGQTLKSFLKDLDEVMKKDLDAIYVFGFDPRPQTPFAQMGKVLPERIREGKVKMMPTLKKLASTYGYRPPTVRPESNAYLHTISSQCRVARRFGSSILGFGASALAHAYGSAWYRHPPIEETTRNWDRIQPYYCMESGSDEEMRGYAVRHMYAQGLISRQNFKNQFSMDVLDNRGLAKIFRKAETEGLICIDSTAVRFTKGDRSQRLVFSKRLYSDELHRRLRASHITDYAEFNAKFSDEDVLRFLPVADKRVAAMMTTFEKAV